MQGASLYGILIAMVLVFRYTQMGYSQLTAMSCEKSAYLTVRILPTFRAGLHQDVIYKEDLCWLKFNLSDLHHLKDNNHLKPKTQAFNLPPSLPESFYTSSSHHRRYLPRHGQQLQQRPSLPIRRPHHRSPLSVLRKAVGGGCCRIRATLQVMQRERLLPFESARLQ